MPPYALSYGDGRGMVQLGSFREALEALFAGDEALIGLFRIDGNGGDRVQLWDDVLGFHSRRLTEAERKAKIVHTTKLSKTFS